MNLQIIKSVTGQAEYVLLPIKTYEILKHEIEAALKHDQNYEVFHLQDYIDNPVAKVRIKANLTQSMLAEKMKVSQAYISKLESQKTVSEKVMLKVMKAVYSEKE